MCALFDPLPTHGGWDRGRGIEMCYRYAVLCQVKSTYEMLKLSKPEAQKRTKPFMVRMKPSDLILLQMASEAGERSVSSLVREGALAKAREILAGRS